jgi:hypothetical protein
MPLLDRCLKGGTELANLANSASASMSSAYVPSDQGRFRVSRTRWWAYTHAPPTSALPASRGRGELPILGHRSRQTFLAAMPGLQCVEGPRVIGFAHAPKQRIHSSARAQPIPDPGRDAGAVGIDGLLFGRGVQQRSKAHGDGEQDGRATFRHRISFVFGQPGKPHPRGQGSPHCLGNDSLRGGGGSEYQWYHDEERKHDFVVQAVVFKTELPVEGILGMMAAVDERLGGPQREPVPLIKMDLMWVEGVEMETPELHLPSPLIFEKYWANRVFVEASEDVMFRSRDEGREKTSVVRRIAKAYKKYHDMDDSAVTFFYETNELSPPELSRKPGGTIYSQEAVDDLNTIAVAGNLLLFAEVDVTRGRSPSTAPDETEGCLLQRSGTC